MPGAFAKKSTTPRQLVRRHRLVRFHSTSPGPRIAAIT
jgi:hypothetical protein